MPASVQLTLGCRAAAVGDLRKKEHSGKTTSALQIGQFWQSLGLRVGVVDLEKSITREYYEMLKFELIQLSVRRTYQPCVSCVYVRHECNKRKDVSLEQVLDTVRQAGNIFDLLIVDSVDALIEESESEKDAGLPVGSGIGVTCVASCARTQQAGSYHMGQPRRCSYQLHARHASSYNTRGGKSIPRYSFVRIELTVVGKRRVNKDADRMASTSASRWSRTRWDPTALCRHPLHLWRRVLPPL